MCVRVCVCAFGCPYFTIRLIYTTHLPAFADVLRTPMAAFIHFQSSKLRCHSPKGTILNSFLQR